MQIAIHNRKCFVANFPPAVHFLWPSIDIILRYNVVSHFINNSDRRPEKTNLNQIDQFQ